MSFSASFAAACSDYYNPVPTEFKGDTDAWATFVRNFLTELGFNTVGAWSSTVLPTNERFVATPILYVVLHEGTRCLAPLQPDFESFVLQNVKDSIAKLPGREGLLGVFLDNEMPWFGKTGFQYVPTYTLLELAFELPTACPSAGCSFSSSTETRPAPAGSRCRPYATSGWSSRACPRPGRRSSTGWSSSGNAARTSAELPL